jgi:hypothetical protein
MRTIRFTIPRLVTLLGGVLAVAAAWNAPPLRADDKALPSDLALASHDPAGFVSIRVGDLVDSAAGKEFLQQLSKEKQGQADLLADLQKELVVAPGDIERLTVALGSQVMIVRTTKAYDRDKIFEPLGEPAVKRYKGRTLFVGAGDNGIMPFDENVFVRGRVQQLQKLVDDASAPAASSALSEPLEQAAGKHQVTAAVSPVALVMLLGTRQDEFREVGAKIEVNPVPPPPPSIEKKNPPPCGESAPEAPDPAQPDMQALLERLPPEALPYKPLLQARYIALTLDVDEGMKAEVRMAYTDKEQTTDGEAAAKTALYVLRQLLPQAMQQLSQDPELDKQLAPAMRQLEEALKTATVHSEGTTVTASAQSKLDLAVFAAMALQVRRRAESVTSQNNLKQIVLAMHDFNDANGSTPPPAICGKDGKPLLSWRVAILPYIEQENLFRQFKLDEPWDSPNNKKLLAQMPKTYAPVHGKTKQPYSTYYQVFVGPDAPFQIIPDNGPLGASGPVIPRNFPDGLSQTILVAEAGEAVPWTKPDDIAFDEKKPVPSLGGDFGFGFHVGMGDGSVLFIKNTIDEKLLKLLIMPADGNVIDWDKVPMIGPEGRYRR